MRFALKSNKFCFTEEEKSKYEKMDFIFEKIKYSLDYEDLANWCEKRSSNPTVKFETFQELKDWAAEMKIEDDFIIDFKEMSITIFDEYD